MTVTIKLRPVPRVWREEHHTLGRVRTHIAGGGWGGHSRTYRSGATCSCGKPFGLDADDHTMNAPEIREAYNEHVAEAYYGPDEPIYIRKETP